MHEVSDMATRLRNALQVGQPEVILRNTKLSKSIVQVLVNEGFLTDFSVIEESNQLKIILKYIGQNQRPSFTHFQAISKPSLRVYRSSKNLPRILGGMGVAILSTPKGVLTQKQAKQEGVGGEVLCYIW